MVPVTKQKTPSYEQRRRKAILDAAQEEFANKGYNGTSLRSIIERVGGSKSTLYAYFGNKEDLFAAVVARTGHDDALPELSENPDKLEETLIVFAEDRLKRVLAKQNIRIMRLVIAEADRFPDNGQVYFNHSPSVTYEKLSSFFARMRLLGVLNVPDEQFATEQFIGPLLMRPLLARLYGVSKEPTVSEIEVQARNNVTAFLKAYAPGYRLEQ
jgi:AcrR family transcriptional regulator